MLRLCPTDRCCGGLRVAGWLSSCAPSASALTQALRPRLAPCPHAPGNCRGVQLPAPKMRSCFGACRLCKKHCFQGDQCCLSSSPWCCSAVPPQHVCASYLRLAWSRTGDLTLRRMLGVRTPPGTLRTTCRRRYGPPLAQALLPCGSGWSQHSFVSQLAHGF